MIYEKLCHETIYYVNSVDRAGVLHASVLVFPRTQDRRFLARPFGVGFDAEPLHSLPFR